MDRAGPVRSILQLDLKQIKDRLGPPAKLDPLSFTSPSGLMRSIEEENFIGSLAR